MRRYIYLTLIFMLIASSLQMLVKVKAQVTGTTTVTVIPNSPPPPVGNQSLLGGQTPATCVSNGCGVSGWQTLFKQDFENGIGGNEEIDFAGISTGQAHSGSHAFMETITANNGGNTSPGGEWILHTGSLGCCGPIGEVYISWYSYLDPNALAGTESFFAAMQNPTQQLLMDTQPVGDGQLSNQMHLWFSPQTGASPSIDCAGIVEDSPLPQNCGFYGGVWTLNTGRWEQEELWIHPSTCSNNVPNNDGFVTMYIDGNLAYHIDSNNSADRTNPMGGNINGCVNMASSPDIQVAGIWTYFFPLLNTFNKYVDDIVILKR